jgi:hypothetical protein
MRRIAAITAVVLGIGMLAVPFATDLWNRTDGAEVTFDAMRGLVSKDGIASARRDFGTVKDGGTQFLTQVRPGLARQLGLNQAQFDALVAQRYPDIARGAQQIPGYLQFVGPTIDALDAKRPQFENADKLPLLGLPLSASPWLFVALGGLLVGTGALALVSARRWALIAMLGVGVAAVALPVAFGIPGKARDARDVGDVARGGLSQAGADKATEIVVVLDKMVAQVKGRLVPDLARRSGVPPAQVQAQLARSYPATATLLARWPSISAGPNGAALAAKQEAVVDDFADADKTPVLELPWLVIVPGALVALLAGLGLGLAPRREAEVASVRT